MTGRAIGAIMLAFTGGWIGGFVFTFDAIPIWSGVLIVLTPGLLVLAAMLLVRRLR